MGPVPPRTQDDSAWNVIVEVPRGSRNKVVWEPDLGVFALHKILPMGATFPFDFGFVPGTLAEDGDPIDVVVLLDEPTFTGCLVPVRLLGAIGVKQGKDGHIVRNDRLVGVAACSRDHATLRELKHLAPHRLDEIEHFFASFLELEGQTFEVVGRWGPGRADALVAAAVKRASEAMA